MRLGLLVAVCALLLSGCTQGQMWGAAFARQISWASNYSPERADLDFRVARPKLARVLSNHFPDRYDAVMEQVSAIVMSSGGDIEAAPLMVETEIAARFGNYAAFAGDEKQRVALDAIIAEFRLSADENTGLCSDTLAPLPVLLRRRAAVDAAIVEGIQAPFNRDPITGEGYAFLVLHLSQRGIGQGILQAFLAGEQFERCNDVATILEAINTLETRDAKGMRAEILARYAVLL